MSGVAAKGISSRVTSPHNAWALRARPRLSLNGSKRRIPFWLFDVFRFDPGRHRQYFPTAEHIRMGTLLPYENIRLGILLAFLAIGATTALVTYFLLLPDAVQLVRRVRRLSSAYRPTQMLASRCAITFGVIQPANIW